MKGYQVIVERDGKRLFSAWRPSLKPAETYARTLSQTTRETDLVYVEDVETKERRWTSS